MRRACLPIALVLTAALVPASARGQTVACEAEKANTLMPYSGDTAHFAVTHLGNVIHRPNRPIDEDDLVIVDVYTTTVIAKTLRLRRTSPFRTVGTINIVGEAAQAATAKDMALTDSPCYLRLSQSDFAPGRGTIEILYVVAEKEKLREIPLGAFDFAVNPLYSGAFSLGGIRSELEAPAFGLVKRGADSVITETTSGDSRVFYALMYTPFIWGKRDLEKPEPLFDRKRWYHRVNPSLGATLQDIGDNALVGVTVDLPMGVFVNWGLHAGKIREVDPTSDLAVGSALAGGPVPTRTRWRSKPYAGVTIDLRVALRFLRTAGSTTF